MQEDILKVNRFPDVQSFRTQKQLWTQFKDQVKSEGMDTCFVLNSFIQGYLEYKMLGHATLPLSPIGQSKETVFNGFMNEPSPNQEAKSHLPNENSLDSIPKFRNVHYHTHLHIHNNYVVKKPRRIIETTDIQEEPQPCYYCQQRIATYKLTTKEQEVRYLCQLCLPLHKHEATSYKPLPPVHLHKVNNRSSINGESQKQNKNPRTEVHTSFSQWLREGVSILKGLLP